MSTAENLFTGSLANDEQGSKVGDPRGSAELEPTRPGTNDPRGSIARNRLGSAGVHREEAAEATTISPPAAMQPVEWQLAHAKLLALAKSRAGLDWEEGRWLVLAKRSGVHIRLGFGSFAE